MTAPGSRAERLARALPPVAFGDVRVARHCDVDADDDRSWSWHSVEVRRGGEWLEVLRVPHAHWIDGPEAAAMAEHAAQALRDAALAGRARILACLAVRSAG